MKIPAEPVADQRAQALLADAVKRDAIADARDLAAQARDDAAAARSLLDYLEDDGTDAAAVGAPHHSCERAVEYRVRATRLRSLAAQDRRSAAWDRNLAADDRAGAALDREALARQLGIGEADPTAEADQEGPREQLPILSDIGDELGSIGLIPATGSPVRLLPPDGD